MPNGNPVIDVGLLFKLAGFNFDFFFNFEICMNFQKFVVSLILIFSLCLELSYYLLDKPHRWHNG